MNNSSNSSSELNDYEERYLKITQVFVGIIVVTALIAMMVNVIVFVSVHWIRRPMPPLLKMSISLAAADALSSSIFAIALFINTSLPLIGINLQRLQIAMEIIKLSGILITVTHLLALSLNHYIGILKPLHYNYIVTRRKVTAVTTLLWIVPTLYVIFLYLCQSDQNYWIENFSSETIERNNKSTFFDSFIFRMSYSSYLIISIILMAICYFHILIIVKKQQNTWKTLSRAGSTKWTGRTTKNWSNTKTSKEQKQLEGNIRAIYTTLLILGSCIIGWLPAILMFNLMCQEDCYFHGAELQDLIQNYLIEFLSIRFLENMLIVLKMLANPIIYSIRMKEIQEGTKHMQAVLLKFFCPFRPDSQNYSLTSQRSHNMNSSSLRTRLTTSINSGNANNHGNSGREELGNTFL